MTNAQINKKLLKLQETIDELREEIEEEIELIEEIEEAIEDKAYEHDRDMTDCEQERYDGLENRKDALQGLLDDYLDIDIEDGYLEE